MPAGTGWTQVGVVPVCMPTAADGADGGGAATGV